VVTQRDSVSETGLTGRVVGGFCYEGRDVEAVVQQAAGSPAGDRSSLVFGRMGPGRR